MRTHFNRLFADNPLEALGNHAARLERLQRVLETGVAAQFAHACRVVNLKDDPVKGDTLIVSARGSAIAVRLKQSLPSLTRHFAQAGYPLAGIKIKVALPTEAPPPRPVPTRTISPEARAQIEALAASLPEDAAPLRTALERLARRSREG
ncbi:hypothetical protein FACS189497_13480 [Betaproteobacteria bacterium]|nr:hypothetical protein FACS189488_07160 [Betaproteobacteria bacterium]GHU32095.1 hypothetical protein FACS189497_13480 [Betaproteobacteria bacterium]